MRSTTELANQAIPGAADHAVNVPGAATGQGAAGGAPRQVGGPDDGPERDRSTQARAADERSAEAASDAGWIDLGALDEIPPLGARTVRLRTGCVAVFRTAGDEVFALADRCPHRGGPLSDGIVHGRAVTCPLHSTVVDLESGEAKGGEGRVAIHSVRVEGGRVLLAAAALVEDAA